MLMALGGYDLEFIFCSLAVPHSPPFTCRLFAALPTTKAFKSSIPRIAHFKGDGLIDSLKRFYCLSNTLISTIVLEHFKL